MRNFYKDQTTSKNLYEQFYSPKTKRCSGVKIIFVVLLSLLLVATIVVFSVLKAKKERQVFGKNVYLLVVGKYDSVANAKDMSDKIKPAGGAGFVWVDKEFWVVAFVYPSLEDAQKVQGQLSPNWTTTIEKKSFKRPKTNSLVEFQKQSCNLLFEMADKFYEFATIVDKTTNQDAKVFGAIVEFKNKINFLLGKLENSDIDLVLRENLEAVGIEIDAFLKSSFPKNLYSSGIKLLCVTAVFACSGLVAELEKLL